MIEFWYTLKNLDSKTNKKTCIFKNNFQHYPTWLLVLLNIFSSMYFVHMGKNNSDAKLFKFIPF